MIKQLQKIKQKAIAFGIDARITLLVTAIAAFVASTTYVTKNSLDNQDVVENELNMLKMGYLNYYEDHNSVPTIANLGAYVYLAEDGNYDVWGNDYVVQYTKNTETLGSTNVEITYFLISSNGPDRVQNTPNITDYNSYLSATNFGDDLFVKFSTKSVDSRFVQQEKYQIQIVESLLNSYIREKVKENQSFCSNVTNQTDVDCDINSDGHYSEYEEAMLNYFPKNIDDSYGKYYLTTNATYSTLNKFKSGYINTSVKPEYNMYTFINLIGGSTDLVKSPRGLVLHFNSNVYSNNQSPYFAEIWYGPEVLSI
jgi:hypothetical protein